jgi:2-oxoglutarate ferredoxin oxidoreductase subunit gamma
LFAGQLLAYAGMDEGLHVTWIPSYGPEMRGGTAHCTVIISDEPIGAPIVSRPDIAIVLNKPSADKYEMLVAPGGLLVVNSSLIEMNRKREDISYVFVPANEIADIHGTNKMLNMAALGAMLGAQPILPLESIIHVLEKQLAGAKAHLLAGNVAVLQQGYRLGAQEIAYLQEQQIT